MPTIGSSSEILVKMSPFKVLLRLPMFCMFEKALNSSGGILWEEDDKVLHKGEQCDL